MDDEEREHLKKLLQVHRANLRMLREREANYGIDVPLELHNRITHEEGEIARIEAQRNRIRQFSPRRRALRTNRPRFAQQINRPPLQEAQIYLLPRLGE